LALAGAGSVKQVDGRVISAAAMNTHNTFERDNAVQPVALVNTSIHNAEVALQLPPMSVAAVTCSAA
jgi:alpha-N-arabinofuranosidase